MSKIDSEKIVSLGLELGADNVVKFSIDQIVFDSDISHSARKSSPSDSFISIYEPLAVIA